MVNTVTTNTVSHNKLTVYLVFTRTKMGEGKNVVWAVRLVQTIVCQRKWLTNLRPLCVCIHISIDIYIRRWTNTNIVQTLSQKKSIEESNASTHIYV